MNLAPSRWLLLLALGLAAGACLDEGTPSQTTPPPVPGGSLAHQPAAPAEAGTIVVTTPLPQLPIPNEPSPAEPSPSESAPDPLPADAFIVHEWGTFTSVQDTAGKSQPGLHHEDEELPSWVYRRELAPNGYSYFEMLPEEPLQQLETPVVYFYAPDRREVTFDVSFPEGIISQWYPEAKSFAPELWMMDAVADGQMRWELTLDPAIDPASFIPVDPQEIWAPSRNVASTPVALQREGWQELEQFIFYRGLGSFDLPVRVTAPDDTRVRIRNDSPDGIAQVFILNVGDEGGAVRALGALGPGATLEAAVPDRLLAHATFVAEAQAALSAGITATGLYRDEAQAMVETWTRSWFGNVGIRVLYLVPRAWTDRLLPIQVTPAPTELVRTLVGRIEVMTPSIEAETLAAIDALGDSPSWDVLEAAIDGMGRFAEPWIRRALEARGTSAAGQQLLEAAHVRP